MVVANDKVGTVDLSGSMTQQSGPVVSARNVKSAA
jgi:hypothetical protein